MTPVNQDKVEWFLNKYGPLRLIKSSTIQMAYSTQSLLAMMPMFVKILNEHHDINPTEVERLTKMLDDKEVALVKRAKEAN